MSSAQRNHANVDLRDRAAYTIAEAARYIRLPAATLRSWVLGRSYPVAGGDGRFPPLIEPASKQPTFLSFWNLIEAHVLRSLRTHHGVSIPDLRKALAYSEEKLAVQRLLLRKELSTSEGALFLEHYGQLINLSASGQLAMRQIFEEHLRRVEWDRWMFPVRLYPFVPSEKIEATRSIVIDPNISFGRPVTRRRGISTAAIAERIDVGETISAIASDYELTREEIEQAVLYERAA